MADTCMFFQLPNDIRYMIFKLAYGEAQRIKARDRDSWTYSESRRKRLDGPHYIDFPESPLAHVLVNKEYFVQAAEYHVRSWTFVFCSWYDLCNALKAERETKKGFLHRITSLSVRNIIPTSAEEALSSLPALRYLEVGIRPHDLDLADDKHAWHYDFSDLDIVGTRDIQYLLKLRGLKHIRAIQNCSPRTKGQSEEDIWRRNFRRLNDLLSEVTSRPRTTSAAEPDALWDSTDWIRLQTGVRPTKAIDEDSSKKLSGPKELPAEDVPTNERDFIRMLCARPRDLFEWVQKSKKHMMHYGAVLE